jgi:hypothetical protein
MLGTVASHQINGEVIQIDIKSIAVDWASQARSHVMQVIPCLAPWLTEQGALERTLEGVEEITCRVEWRYQT